MADHANQTILTVDEFVALLNSGGWQMCGGAYAKTAVEAVGLLELGEAWVHPLGEIKIPVAAPNFADTYSVPLADVTVMRPKPHVLHVNKVFPQKQMGKGGVERWVPLLGVWLKFVNLDIKAKQDLQRMQAKDRERRRQMALNHSRHQSLIAVAGVVGSTLIDMASKDEGVSLTLTFSDGKTLVIDRMPMRRDLTLWRADRAAPNAFGEPEPDDADCINLGGFSEEPIE